MSDFGRFDTDGPATGAWQETHELVDVCCPQTPGSIHNLLQPLVDEQVLL